MNPPTLLTRATQALKTHSPETLTALGVTGVVTTAYLTGKGACQAARTIDYVEARGGVSSDRKQRFKENFLLTWRFYAPAAVAGSVTIACIVGLQRVGSRRAAAAATAVAVAERTYNEYREQVVEQLGKTKEQKVRDHIAQERVNETPASKEIVVVSSGHVLCCDLFTMRYIRSNMDTLKRAETAVNERIYTDMYVMLSEFYDMIGLSHTSQSDYLGWEDKPLELRISTVLSEGTNPEPCLAFDFNYIKPLG